MGRLAGAKSYNKEALVYCVTKVKPSSLTDWKKVAKKYKVKANEEFERDEKAIKRYFLDTLCNKMKKPSGDTGSISNNIILKSQKFWKDVMENDMVENLGDDDDETSSFASCDEAKQDVGEPEDTSFEEQRGPVHILDISEDSEDEDVSTKRAADTKVGKNSEIKTKNSRNPRTSTASIINQLANTISSSQESNILLLLLQQQQQRQQQQMQQAMMQQQTKMMQMLCFAFGNRSMPMTPFNSSKNLKDSSTASSSDPRSFLDYDNNI